MPPTHRFVAGQVGSVESHPPRVSWVDDVCSCDGSFESNCDPERFYPDLTEVRRICCPMHCVICL